MKIRTGFVSNSSSSSYLIAVKGTKPPCEHCGRSYPDLIDLIRSSANDCENEVRREGIEEVVLSLRSDLEQAKTKLREIKSNPESSGFYYKDSAPTPEVIAKYTKMYSEEVAKLTDLIQRCKELSDDGYKIADISISYNAEYIKEQFEALQKSGNVIILDGDTE